MYAPGVALHVIQRGNDRTALFVDGEDFTRFRSLMALAAARYGIVVHAYVLMTNHVHLLATPRGERCMPRAMHWVGGVFAQYLNAKYSRTGSRFEGRYRAAAVHDDTYLLTCMRYVELNAVRAGIVADPADYSWSSFRANALGEADGLVTRHPVFHDLGRDARQRQSAYRELFRGAIPDRTLDAIRAATRHGWALGDDAFVRRISAQCRRAAPLRAGAIRAKV